MVSTACQMSWRWLHHEPATRRLTCMHEILRERDLPAARAWSCFRARVCLTWARTSGCSRLYVSRACPGRADLRVRADIGEIVRAAGGEHPAAWAGPGEVLASELGRAERRSFSYYPRYTMMSGA